AASKSAPAALCSLAAGGRVPATQPARQSARAMAGASRADIHPHRPRARAVVSPRLSPWRRPSPSMDPRAKPSTMSDVTPPPSKGTALLAYLLVCAGLGAAWVPTSFVLSRAGDAVL